MLTLTDIRVADDTLQTMPRLEALRKACLSNRAEVCIERAHHVTTFLRDMADDNEAMEIRYAKAVAHYLSKKVPLFFDDNLLAGKVLLLGRHDVLAEK